DRQLRRAGDVDHLLGGQVEAVDGDGLGHGNSKYFLNEVERGSRSSVVKLLNRLPAFRVA
ncbi:hypothetical protein V8G57_08155, partial [Collimonas sp. H4R21]